VACVAEAVDGEAGLGLGEHAIRDDQVKAR
jgi:hypothetical protein